ncbi:MAG: hypothetical protein IKW26_09310, partial [Treponema sp.]|nr:hypothetical protein [Treponema sp.]
NLVEWLALDELREEVQGQQKQKTIEAAVVFASAAALSVAAYFQPWLLLVIGPLLVAGIAATDVAFSLGAVKDGLSDLLKGNKENALKASESLTSLLNNLQEGKNNLQKERELLNLFYYGTKEEPAVAEDAVPKQALTVESILASVQKMLNQNQLVSPQEYKNLLTTELLASLLEPETNNLDGKQGQKISDVLQKAALQLKREYVQAEEILSKEAGNIQESSQAALTGFYQVLNQSLEISQEDREKLILLEAQATDESLSTAQRQLAMNEYQALYQSLFAMESATQQQLANLASLAYGSEGWDNFQHKENVYNSYKSLYNTKVDLASGTEEYTAWLQALMVQQARSGWEDSALQVIGQSQHQWQLEYDLLNRRQGLWEAEVMETLSAGAKSWQRVEEKLNKEYTLWRRSFQKELEERQGEWEHNYLDFLQKKETWVQESHRQGLVQGLGQEFAVDAEAASGLGMVNFINQDELEAQLTQLSRSMESGISSKTTEAVVESLLATSYLDQLISHSSVIASFGKNAGSGIRKNYRSTTALESQLVAQQQAAKTSQLMKDAVGRQAVDYGQNLLEQILASYLSGIDSQNQAMVDWQESLARDAGYTVDGSIRRTIVVDATLMNPIKETQYLPIYQQYTPNSPNLRKVDATSSETAMLQLGLAQKELELWGQSIFGEEGLLSKHIGVAPTMVESPDPSGSKNEAFEDEGSGQFRDILVDYCWNSIQASKGMYELGKAGYDKRLFDDRGLPFTAPTLRQVTEIAMNIVGNVTGQVWLGYFDDVIFAGMDLTGGYKTAEEIGKELAIKATSAAIGAGTSWAGNVAGKALANSGKAVNFLVQGSISGSGAYLGGVATSYIATGKGGWGDVGNLAGLASGFVSGGLGGVNLRDGNGIKLNSTVFNVEGISAMNGLVGGLASTAVNFAMTGNATFNLASIKGVGLLEVTIGKDGISSRLGSGGMSLSSETLMLAASGRQEAGKVMDWKYGTDESRSTLNGINQLGYTNIQVNHDLANDIWNEQIGVDYADIAGYGLYKVGEKSITLNSDLLGGGLEESAKLATVLSHEGTHLYGNRIEGIAHLQGATTYMQL